jgi:hypothetical protein
MPVVVQYVATIGEVSLNKRDGNYLFTIQPSLSDGKGTEHCEEVRQNAFAIRDEFLRLKTPSEAFDFLSKTGQFSPVHYTLSWIELQKWQRFAHLVQEHAQLARAMDQGLLTGECAEVLKALTGIYDSSFFDLPESETDLSDRLWFEEQVKRNPELTGFAEEGKRKNAERRRQLWKWFRRPAGKACSIEWIPKNPQPNDGELFRKLQVGGTMIEFLLPREELRPVFLIRPAYMLEAIAASIFADRANGIEYRSCECCLELFPLGSHKNKLYCNQERCKNTAHQRRKRASLRDQKLTDSATDKLRLPAKRAKRR